MKFKKIAFYCFVFFYISNSSEKIKYFSLNNEIITSIDLVNEIEYLTLLNTNLGVEKNEYLKFIILIEKKLKNSSIKNL